LSRDLADPFTIVFSLVKALEHLKQSFQYWTPATYWHALAALPETLISQNFNLRGPTSFALTRVVVLDSLGSWSQEERRSRTVTP
jgi:hypothetical protein